MAKRKWSKLTKILLGTTIGTLVLSGGFLGLFLANAAGALGMTSMIVADFAIVGMATTLAVGLTTAIRAIVRQSGRFGNKGKEFKHFHQMDKQQNSTERQATVSQQALLKNAIKYANVRLVHMKLNSLPVTGRRFFFNGTDKQNIYKNHLEALNFAKQVHQTAGNTRKVRHLEKEIGKYERLLAKEEENSTPLNLKYTWTRMVQDPVSHAVIPDHRSEIACMKSGTLFAFKQLVSDAEINKEYGNAVRINYNIESGYLNPYACLNDENKMEHAELLLCKEAFEIALTEGNGMDVFPLEVERISLKDSKTTTQRIRTIEELEKYIATLEKVVNPEVKTKFTTRKYLTRAYQTEEEKKPQPEQADPAAQNNGQEQQH